jgi:aryl-alcohol dehydrogenase-like predicted oxidoreductase
MGMTRLATPDGAPLSPLMFGTMQFGGRADEGASAAMWAACRAAGINAFDTAHAYTGGRSEEILGRLARAERGAVFLASKCRFDRPLTAATVRASWEDSARRLGVETIDLFYLHRWDGETPLEETFGALATLVREGKVRHVGVSNFAAWQTMKATHAAAAHGLCLAALQPMLNLVKRQAEVEILPMARSEGFAAFPYSPLGGGLLTGKYAAGGAGRLTEDEMYARRYGAASAHAAAGAFARLAAEAGWQSATLAVAWVAARPGVTAPIVSARSADQLAPSLAALGRAVPDDLLAALDALSPPPPPATDRSEEA